MNARQVKAEFNRMWRDNVALHPEYANDECAKSFEFACYIDALCKDGIISQRTFNTITL